MRSHKPGWLNILLSILFILQVQFDWASSSDTAGKYGSFAFRCSPKGNYRRNSCKEERFLIDSKQESKSKFCSCNKSGTLSVWNCQASRCLKLSTITVIRLWNWQEPEDFLHMYNLIQEPQSHNQRIFTPPYCADVSTGIKENQTIKNLQHPCAAPLWNSLKIFRYTKFKWVGNILLSRRHSQARKIYVCGW